MKEKVPVGILISGRGSNMLALLKACQEKDYPCEPVIVISNRPDAAGLKIAEDADVPTYVVDHKDFPNREKFEEELSKKLKNSGAQILCNAGFMRILTEQFTQQWHDQHLNIHPSLLPRFPGTHVHQRVLESGDKITGCTVHYVRAAVDSGPRIGQSMTCVRPDDTVETLEERVLLLEHKLYPRVLRQVAEGRAQIIADSALIIEQCVIEQCVNLLDSKNATITSAEKTLQPGNQPSPHASWQITKENARAYLDSVSAVKQRVSIFFASENATIASAEKTLQPGNQPSPHASWQIAKENIKAINILEFLSNLTEEHLPLLMKKMLKTGQDDNSDYQHITTKKYEHANDNLNGFLERHPITLKKDSPHKNTSLEAWTIAPRQVTKRSVSVNVGISL